MLGCSLLLSVACGGSSEDSEAVGADASTPTPTASASGDDREIEALQTTEPSSAVAPVEVELVQAGFEGVEYLCEKGGVTSGEIFDYAAPLEEITTTPREQLESALRGRDLADPLEEMVRVRTVFWRTFDPWVDTPVGLDADEVFRVFDFGFDETLVGIGAPGEGEELRMYVDILDLTRPENQVAGLAEFNFIGNAGWLLTRLNLCESVATGGSYPREAEGRND